MENRFEHFIRFEMHGISHFLSVFLFSNIYIINSPCLNAVFSNKDTVESQDSISVYIGPSPMKWRKREK